MISRPATTAGGAWAWVRGSGPRQGSADATATPPCHCDLELTIPFVEEDDPTVTLQIRWFIDYNPAVPATVRPWQDYSLDGSFDNPSTIRALTQTFDFDADAAGIVTNGIHIVTAVVGEKTGFDDSPTAARPNRTMKGGFAADEYPFTVNVSVQQDASRPTCPVEKPSLRVCQ